MGLHRLSGRFVNHDEKYSGLAVAGVRGYRARTLEEALRP